MMENIKENITTDEIWKLMEDINDPEIPVLSITDLGIVRDIKLTDSGVEVFITPTYSGCPAMDVISMNIRMTLLKEGFGVEPSSLKTKWQEKVTEIFSEATLAYPKSVLQQAGGKEGRHTENLGKILAELQFMQRTYPDSVW